MNTGSTLLPLLHLNPFYQPHEFGSSALPPLYYVIENDVANRQSIVCAVLGITKDVA